MPFLTALLSFASRKLGDVVRAVFGWSVTTLFGKLGRREQTAMSVILLLSIAWPLLVVGCFAPAVAAWAVTFVPLEEYIPEVALRVAWVALAASVPPVVGLLTWWITPGERRKRSRAATIVGGFVMVPGYALAFAITVLTVPIVKLLSIGRRWSDTHVFVQARPGQYGNVVAVLERCCRQSRLLVVRERLPFQLELATTVTRFFAAPFVVPRNGGPLQRLRGDGLELYLYPADLMVRGEAEKVARVRAAIARSDITAYAYLVESVRGQHLQDQVDMIPEAPPIEDATIRREHERLRLRLDHARLAYDEWALLDARLGRSDARVGTTPRALVPSATSRRPGRSVSTTRDTYH